MKTQQTFGQILRQKRIERGWKQCQLADKLGIHQNTIILYEQDRGNPTMFVLTDLADIFECSLDELVGRVYSDENI